MPFSRKKTKFVRKPVYKKAVIRQAPRQEVKRNMRSVDTSISSLPIVSVNSSPFKNIATGSLSDKRIGNMINAKGHLLSGVMRNASARVMLVRIIHLYNRRVANSVIDQDSLMFLNLGNPDDATSIQFKTMFAPLNRSHYKIVSDQRYKLGASGDNATNVRILKKYIKLNHQVKYDDSVGANLNHGNLQIVLFCYPADGNPIAADEVSLDFESTVYYTE